MYFSLACELDQQRLRGKAFALQDHNPCAVAFGGTLRVLSQGTVATLSCK